MKTQTLTKSVVAKKPASGAKNGAKKNGTLNGGSNGAHKPGDQATEPVGDEENVTASMAAFQEEEIAARAYYIWMQRGCPDGCDEENWHQAEQELASASKV
ncbi:DUF2934 domain-containing protein [Brevifollis gellanilyticus]|uniref:DUF2934 domain-containing protein n=1 Tax=Brevifollis gellanilyticus TaxID=748831 RepID=A0A512MEC2_9BACT|nr:DUF2934 domain-containing protein [Brevifollis gellanilyticus]GEP45066.1 hypothetical protein BGE01nite_43570 [Brevifollis gellanilyticus]